MERAFLGPFGALNFFKKNEEKNIDTTKCFQKIFLSKKT
jgi:hypothetical protein